MLLKIGGVVVAGPRGPVMSVARIDGDQAYCEWFARGANRLAAFPIQSLRPAGAWDDADSAVAATA